MNNAELDILISKISGGDMDALEELYRDTKDSVYSYALSVLRNPHDAEDVLQECYIRVFRGASGYRSQKKPMAWILTIVKKLCMARFRDSAVRTELTEEEWNDRLEDVGGLTTEEKIVLKDCLLLLVDEERKIVVLHAVAGFKHREIAEFMGIPLSTVLSKYTRALAKLKKM